MKEGKPLPVSFASPLSFGRGGQGGEAAPRSSGRGGQGGEASFLFVLLLLLLACTNDAPPTGTTVTGRDSLPVMVTHGVSKIISDSGVPRYKIITEEWRIYDKTTPPRWTFPKGIFIERFDDKFKPDLYIEADSAWLYDQNLWHLRGHIVMHDQTAGSVLTTEELYWDMNEGHLSSDVYTRLVEPRQAIEGNWFRATMRGGRPTQYHIRQTKGFMPMGDITGSSSSAAPAPTPDGAPADTAAAPEPDHSAPVARKKSTN